VLLAPACAGCPVASLRDLLSTAIPLDPIPDEEPAVVVGSGDATPDSVVLWAKATTAGPLQFAWSTDPSLLDASLAEVEVTDPLEPARVALAGLSPGTTYHYSASDAAGLSTRGRFRTPRAPGTRAGLRFGVSGDWRGDLLVYPAIANLPQRDLDFFVALGDTVYADVPSPAVPLGPCRTLEEFRRKHAEGVGRRFGSAALAEARAATAWLSMIDDHEVTNDFAGGAAPASDARFAGDDAPLINRTELFETALRVFHEYHPLREEFYGDVDDPRFRGRRKLYRQRRFGDDAAVFLLDTRSFRDAAIAGGLAGLLEPAAFERRSFAQGRTLLGEVQLEELIRDVLTAQQAGITWKFVLVPEPIQNLGPPAGGDRFEGYARERTRLLRTLHEGGVTNLVFIAADIHGTIVNNLTYQEYAGGPQIATAFWEITTGPVAYAPPLGPAVMQIAGSVPVFGCLLRLPYDLADRAGRDRLLADWLNGLLVWWGYDPIGLEGSGIPARLLAGDWVSMHTFGWTEFEIDKQTQELRVTTWGIDWYDQAQVLSDPDGVLRREPQVVSEFLVAPAPG
jgi:3-phytase/alkaline phosphatase D